MKNYLLFIPLLLLCCSRPDGPNKASYVFPPEWEIQEAIWTDFSSEFVVIPNAKAKASIISTLSRYIKTKVVFDSDSLKEVAINLLQEMDANMDSVIFVRTSESTPWMRDPGPVFVTNGSAIKSLDFGWNCYGEAYDCDGDYRGTVDNELAMEMNLDIDTIDLNLEIGGIEVSNNTIIAYKAMASQRNPDKTLEEVTNLLLSAFGKEQIIWLDEFPLIDKPHNKIANYFGQGANGHIDVTTRFLNDSTIMATVIAEADKEKSPLLKKDYEILQSNLKQLKTAKQPNGKPYTIITVEAPDYSLYEYKWAMPDWFWYGLPQELQEKFTAGDTIIQVPALEYANFTITNGAVLVSEYWKEGMPESEKIKDEEIKAKLQQYFPDRDIVGLDVMPINWGGGGIHCRTKQQPQINRQNEEDIFYDNAAAFLELSEEQIIKHKTDNRR